MSDTSMFRKSATAVRPWLSVASLGITDSDLTTTHHPSARFPYPVTGPDARHHHRTQHQHRKGA